MLHAATWDGQNSHQSAQLWDTAAGQPLALLLDEAAPTAMLERTRVMLGGLLAVERWRAQKEREGKGPARKGECPCGSGKRYKRCCGAG